MSPLIFTALLVFGLLGFLGINHVMAQKVAPSPYHAVATAVFYGDPTEAKDWIISRANTGWRVTTISLSGGDYSTQHIFVVMNR